MRFLKLEQPAKLRTHEDALRVGMDYIQNKTLTDAKGLKGLSCMIAFANFDLAAGYPIDYMHGTPLGTLKLMLDIWLGKKRLHYEETEKYNFKPLIPSKRIELNRRILALKPPTRIRHKPRSIFRPQFLHCKRVQEFTMVLPEIQSKRSSGLQTYQTF